LGFLFNKDKQRKMEIKNYLFYILLLSFFISGCADLIENTVCFRGRCFYVELAQTPQQRQQGLMFRVDLEADKGMLFVFEEEGIYPFWMKNTLIPLDIIWMNKNKEVIFMAENIQPCKIEPCPRIDPLLKAKYVLELNAGTAGEIGLSLGDQLKFNISK